MRFVATPEKIEEINRIYYECGIKAETARRIGCSASTIAKYITPGWQPPEVISEGIEEILERKIMEPEGVQSFLVYVSGADNPYTAFCEYCKLSDEEWQEMKAIQAEFVKI